MHATEIAFIIIIIFPGYIHLNIGYAILCELSIGKLLLILLLKYNSSQLLINLYFICLFCFRFVCFSLVITLCFFIYYILITY